MDYQPNLKWRNVEINYVWYHNMLLVTTVIKSRIPVNLKPRLCREYNELGGGIVLCVGKRKVHIDCANADSLTGMAKTRILRKKALCYANQTCTAMKEPTRGDFSTNTLVITTRVSLYRGRVMNAIGNASLLPDRSAIFYMRYTANIIPRYKISKVGRYYVRCVPLLLCACEICRRQV